MTVIVTDTGVDTPFAFVAVALKMYVPTAAGVNVNVDVAVGVAATGVCVKATAGPVPPVRVHAKVGAGREPVVATTVTGDAAALPSVTVWSCMALIVGAGAAATVMVESTNAEPHTLDAVSLTLYGPGASPVALNVGVVVVALVNAAFKSVPPSVVPAVHASATGDVALALTLPDNWMLAPLATENGPLIVGVAHTRDGGETLLGHGLRTPAITPVKDE